MNPFQSRPCQVPLVGLCFLVAVLITSPAIAQLSAPGFASYSTASNYTAPGASFSYQWFSTAANDAGNTVYMKLTGDWDYQLPRADGNGFVETTVLLNMTTGNLPVEVENFVLTEDAKWVNGGGNHAAVPTTDPIKVYGAIIEQLGGSFNTFDPVAVSVLSPFSTLTGNGFTIINDSYTSTDTPYVLSANRTYNLYMLVSTSFTVTNLQNWPSVTITNEFGPPLSAFEGFKVGFDWHTVPEPGSMGLAAVATLGFAAVCYRRRRRC